MPRTHGVSWRNSSVLAAMMWSVEHCNQLNSTRITPSADAPRLQDFYNFLLDSASDPISLAAVEVPRRLSMKIYPTYLSSKASSMSTDISSLMNGAIKDKLKIIPKTVRYVIWSDPILEVEARFIAVALCLQLGRAGWSCLRSSCRWLHEAKNQWGCRLILSTWLLLVHACSCHELTLHLQVDELLSLGINVNIYNGQVWVN